MIGFEISSSMKISLSMSTKVSWPSDRLGFGRPPSISIKITGLSRGMDPGVPSWMSTLTRFLQALSLSEYTSGVILRLSFSVSRVRFCVTLLLARVRLSLFYALGTFRF